MKGITFQHTKGEGLHIGIVQARWNNEYTDSLTQACVDALNTCGVQQEDIIVTQVPGSYEVVRGAKYMIEEKKVDAVIAIGVLIKGETMHFEYISDAVSKGLMDLNIAYDIPVIFGVLTCLTEEQARERSVGEKNHGGGWGMSAVEMARLIKNGD